MYGKLDKLKIRVPETIVSRHFLLKLECFLYIMYYKQEKHRIGMDMDRKIVKARAKINLSLDVTGKRPDGYHDVCMIMQTIDLHDTIEIAKEESGIALSTDNSGLTNGEGNIAFRAAALFIRNTGIRGGVSIAIKKRIPIAAGLAGGSTDAASVLRGMNMLFETGLSDEELRKIGLQLGADVPFCISGGTALAEGLGEILTPLGSLAGIDIVLVSPRVAVSTAWVYSRLDMVNIMDKPDMEVLAMAAKNKDILLLARNMKNVLEQVTIPSFPIVAEVKKLLVRAGATGSMMSGSGPSVFGIFASRKSAEAAYEMLSKDERWDCFITQTI